MSHCLLDSCRYSSLDVRRKNANRESTGPLKVWLYQHIKNPYPTKTEKIMLAIITKMTLTQISTWFANARRRIKKDDKTHGLSTRDRNKSDEDDFDSIAMETRQNDIRLVSCGDVSDNFNDVANVGKRTGPNKLTRSSATAEIARDTVDIDFSVDDVHTAMH